MLFAVQAGLAQDVLALSWCTKCCLPYLVVHPTPLLLPLPPGCEKKVGSRAEQKCEGEYWNRASEMLCLPLSFALYHFVFFVSLFRSTSWECGKVAKVGKVMEMDVPVCPNLRNCMIDLQKDNRFTAQSNLGLVPLDVVLHQCKSGTAGTMDALSFCGSITIVQDLVSSAWAGTSCRVSTGGRRLAVWCGD